MARIRYSEAEKYTAIPTGTLRSLVSKRQIPHIGLGKRSVVFDTEQLDAWLAERSVPARKVQP